MKTVLTTSPDEAANFIKGGGIVAFPTETVYGLGADVFNEPAVIKIFAAKERPPDNPLIAHIGHLDQLASLAREVPPAARDLIEAFFPGPLTLVLNKAERVPLVATAGLHTVGVRMPSAKLAHAFLSACGTPVVAPSANLSGRPSPTTWQAVLDDLKGRIDCILQGERTQLGLESTVVDCTVSPPVILRLGSLGPEELRSVAPAIQVYRAAPGGTVRSPGMRHKHYAPRAHVQLVGSPLEILLAADSGYIGLEPPVQKFEKALICGSVEEYARDVFAFFRDCDKAGISTIFCQVVAETGIGAALMDRLERAAAR